MPNLVKNDPKTEKTESGKKGWKLNPAQGALLQDLFRGKFEDGDYDAEEEFAWHVVIEELIKPANTGTQPRPRSDYDSEIKSAQQHMSRIIRGRRPLSRAKLRVYAKVSGMEYSLLRSQLGLPNRGQDSESIPQTESPESAGPHPQYSRTPAIYVPWKTDEPTLQKHRSVLHQYHQSKQGEEIFWIYVPLNFRQKTPGCLYSSFTFPMGDNIPCDAFGYLFRELLLIVFATVDPSAEQESIYLYYDFATPIKRHRDHWGIIHHADWDLEIGVTACLISRKPILGIKTPGRVDPEKSKALDEHWRKLDGHRCNRILDLFGCRRYVRKASSK